MQVDTRPIIVSIRCTVYNHEPYLRDCLNGFVMQKTNFRFEAIVHDDASTDGSAAIIREYAEKYPDIIKPIYQTENQYSQGKGGVSNAIAAATSPESKYIAICEGDDYWIDENKLQEQVDWLEQHPEGVMVVTNGISLNCASHKTRVINPYGKGIKSCALTKKQIFREQGGLVPTASMCVRKELYMNKRPSFMYPLHVGDRPLRMWCCLKGDIYYMSKPMVVYRTGSIGSFSQRSRSNRTYATKLYESYIKFLDDFDVYTTGKFSDDVAYMKAREEYIYYGRLGCRWRFLFSGHFWTYFSEHSLRRVLSYFKTALIELFHELHKKKNT